MQQYHIVSRIAIYSLSVVLIVLGILHLTHPRDMVVFIPVSIPGGSVWTFFVGIAFILVGFSFIFNKWVKFTGYILAFLLLFFLVPMHVYNSIFAGEKDMKLVAFIDVLKDSVIAFFALHVAAGAHHQQLHLENSD